MYYVLESNDNYYNLSCASYGFDDDEEIMSSTNDIVCNKSYKLIINQYVKFDDEVVDKSDSRYIVSGKPKIYKNKITDNDRKTYDEEFDLSIKAYQENNKDGIRRWEEYLKLYEDKFMAFEPIER